MIDAPSSEMVPTSYSSRYNRPHAEYNVTLNGAISQKQPHRKLQCRFNVHRVLPAHKPRVSCRMQNQTNPVHQSKHLPPEIKGEYHQLPEGAPTTACFAMLGSWLVFAAVLEDSCWFRTRFACMAGEWTEAAKVDAAEFCSLSVPDCGVDFCPLTRGVLDWTPP